jgi:hypothetical protein
MWSPLLVGVLALLAIALLLGVGYGASLVFALRSGFRNLEKPRATLSENSEYLFLTISFPRHVRSMVVTGISIDRCLAEELQVIPPTGFQARSVEVLEFDRFEPDYEDCFPEGRQPSNKEFDAEARTQYENYVREQKSVQETKMQLTGRYRITPRRNRITLAKQGVSEAAGIISIEGHRRFGLVFEAWSLSVHYPPTKDSSHDKD